MYNAVIKSLSIVFNNPVLIFSFIIYLIFLNIALPKLFVAQNIFMSVLILFVALLLSAGFFSGWLQMIKTAIKNSKIENKTDEQKVQEMVEIRNDFFAAVPVYFMPIFWAIILYILMFFTLMALNVKFANHYFGSLDFFRETINLASQNPENIQNLIQNLPQEKLLILWNWQTLFLMTIGIFNFLLMFWLSALYYPSKCKANSLSALKDSILAIIKHPLRSFTLYFFILLMVFIFKILSVSFSTNVILYFLFMVFGIYFWVFIFVLIFDYYEQRFYTHGDNWCNLIGKNKTGD